jgi:hypothetical protein
MLLANAYKNKSDIKYCTAEWKELYSHTSKLQAFAKYRHILWPTARPPATTELGTIVRMYEPLKEGGFHTEWVRKKRRVKGKFIGLSTGKWQIASRSENFYGGLFSLRPAVASS